MDKLIFEGQYAPHLYFYQGLVQSGGRLYRKPVWAWSAAFTPQLRLRMLSTTSRPVVPPSYMPRPLLDWQLFRASVDMSTDSTAFPHSPIRLWGFTVSPWSHHSNGQTGCFFSDQIETGPTEQERCTNPPLIPSPRELNRTNGSFSTNFIAAAVNYRSIRTHVVARGLNEAEKVCTYSLQADIHPVGYLPGGISAEQASIYPTSQMHLRIEGTRPAGVFGTLPGRVALTVAVDYLNRTPPKVSHWVFQPEVSHTPDRFGGWGLFARLFHGMDYYNFNFVDQKRWVQIGFVHSASRAEQFGLPSDRPVDGRYPDPGVLDNIAAPLDAACRFVNR